MWSLILILVMTPSQIGKIDRFRISDLNDRLDLGRFNPHAPSCGGGALRKSLPSITSSSIDQIEIPLDQSGSRNTAGSSGLLQTIFNQTKTGFNQKPVSTGSSDSDQTKPRKTPKPKRNSFRGKLVSFKKIVLLDMTYHYKIGSLVTLNCSLAPQWEKN